MQASSSWGRYQGYPYVNPHFTDAPTSNPAQTSRWANLPRRPQSGDFSRPAAVYEPGQVATAPSVERRVETPSNATVTLPQKPEPEENPVVYIDLPEEDGNDVSEYREERREPVRVERRVETPSSATVTLPQKPEPDENPVVYIDLPEEDGNDVSEYREERREPVRVESQGPSASSSRPQLPYKPDPNANPVVYIDLMVDGESDVSQREHTEPQYVQETIFFDPFENKRIDIARANTVRSNSSWNSESDVDSIDTPVRVPPPRPQRPRNLELPGSSASGSTATPPISFISSPGSDSYTRPIPESNLPPPLPITGFPEPPPAYTVYDMRNPTPTRTVVGQPQPPRTQVIVPGPPVGIPNLDRKYLICHHCGMQVHTLVVKEVGMITHLCALLCLLICMLPIVVMIYYMDCLKNRNHFCPNCYKIIAYELPLNTKKVMYVP